MNKKDNTPPELSVQFEGLMKTLTTAEKRLVKTMLKEAPSYKPVLESMAGQMGELFAAYLMITTGITQVANPKEEISGAAIKSVKIGLQRARRVMDALDSVAAAAHIAVSLKEGLAGAGADASPGMSDVADVVMGEFGHEPEDNTKGEDVTPPSFQPSKEWN